MNLKRPDCCVSLCVCLCVSSPLRGIFFFASYHITAECEVLAVTRSPGQGVAQRLLGFCAEFTSKIERGAGDAASSPVRTRPSLCLQHDQPRGCECK